MNPIFFDVEPIRRAQHTHREFGLVLVDQHADLDLTGRDRLDVDAAVGECAAHRARGDVVDRFGYIWSTTMFATAALNLAIALLLTQWWPLLAANFPLASKFALFAIYVWVIHAVRLSRARDSFVAAVRR